MIVTYHARERLAERHGIALSDDQWGAVLALCVARKVVTVSRRLYGKRIVAVPFGPLTLRMLWDPITRTIITVMP